MKSKFKKYFILVTIFFLIAVTPKNGWSAMWDCGPPSYIVDYENQSPGAQTSRSFLFSTTNIIPPVLITYSSASFSGTSGCGGSSNDSDGGSSNDSDGWAQKIEQQEFVVSNWEELTEQTAKGIGPHLSGLATLMGCPQVHHEQFAKTLQQNHATLFLKFTVNSENTENLMFMITKIIQKQPLLSAKCLLHG